MLSYFFTFLDISCLLNGEIYIFFFCSSAKNKIFKLLTIWPRRDDSDVWSRIESDMFPLIRGHFTKPKVDVRLLLTIQECRFIQRSLLSSCNLSYLQVNMMLRDCGLPARWWEMAWKCFTTWPKYSKRKREYVYIIVWRCLEFIFCYIYTATGVKGCYLP